MSVIYTFAEKNFLYFRYNSETRRGYTRSRSFEKPTITRGLI